MKCDILTLETKYHLFIGKRLQPQKNATITNRGGCVPIIFMSEILHHLSGEGDILWLTISSSVRLSG